MSAPLDYASRPLHRAIGLPGAVMLGLGAILGSGVFVGLPQATAIAGPWVLVSILLAGGLAFCNAMSSAQLAAAHPVSGGTYEYGYRYLSPAWGFAAGWSFLLAKSASAATAAIALTDLIVGRATFIEARSGVASSVRTAASFILADRPLTVAAPLVCVVGICVAALIGLRRTARLNNIIVSCTLAGLIAFIVLGVRFLLLVRIDYFIHQFVDSILNAKHAELQAIPLATALSFVAFTGYGRLATLGEEVENPRRTIPRAIVATLSIAIVIYLAVGALVWIVGYRSWSDSNEVVKVVGCAAYFASGWRSAPTAEVLNWLVQLAAVTAMLGVLLNLVLGLSRVWLAMGRRGDMPRGLAAVHARTGTPVPATILAGVVIALLVLVGRDVKTTWSFSAFSVLIYYAITNLACLRLPAESRRFPRWLAWIGLFACLSLAFFIELPVAPAGVVLIGVGMLWHVWRRARLAPSPP